MLRILLLDDDPLFCDNLAAVLRACTDPVLDVTIVTKVAAAQQAVQTAPHTFDMFLIDQLLDDGSEGIEVMRTLRQESPDTGAIIFTGAGDYEVGMRAYKAGAFHYLSKLSAEEEIIWHIQEFYRQRNAQYEHSWQKVLTDIAEEALSAVRLQEVAQVIVKGGQQLGFERARLWALSEKEQMLRGVCQAGNRGLGYFNKISFSVNESPYAELVLQRRNPVRVSRQQFGPGYLDRARGPQGFEPPVGEVVYVPLWIGDRCWGILTLDNAVRQLLIRQDQERLLGLFARQAVAALERAHLYEQEMRQIRELHVLNEIGRRVAQYAMRSDLDVLLEEVQRQVSQQIELGGFVVALRDEESGRINYRLRSEAGKQQAGIWSRHQDGLLAHIIDKDKDLFLPKGTKRYRRTHKLKLLGKAAKSWMGVPLRVEGHVIGAIAVEHYTLPGAYTEETWRTFKDIAEQVAGGIQTARLIEQEREKRQQLAVLHHATEIMMGIAEESHYRLWHVMLTVATAHYALGFNRAMLFLSKAQHTQLHGRMGIGHFDRKRARRDWNRDIRYHLSFEKYLTRLRRDKLHQTPVEKVMSSQIIDLTGQPTVFHRILNGAPRQIVAAEDVTREFPEQFITQFGVTDYAVLPLRAGSTVLGVLVVDNIHDNKPLLSTALEHLEPLLNQAALILENSNQRRAKDAVINLTWSTISQLGKQPLGDLLQELCESAKRLSKADYVVLYPLKSGKEPFEYDREYIVRIGQISDLQPPHAPHRAGLTAHILRSGTRTIPNVQERQFSHGGQPLASHNFVRHEQIQALIGAPLRNVDTDTPVGVLYLNYRTPRTFDAQDIRQAETFASLAALAIRHSKAVGDANSETRAREAELRSLQSVLKQALVSGPEDRDVLIHSMLSAVYELINMPDIRVQLLLLTWDASRELERESGPSRIQYRLGSDRQLSSITVPEIFQGISGRALAEKQTILVEDVYDETWSQYFHPHTDFATRSELDVPFRLSNSDMIAVINIESLRPGAFTKAHAQTIERLADGAALALDNLYRQQRLQNILEAASAVTTPVDLKMTLSSIERAVRKAMPNLDVMTIWYREPQTKTLTLGTHFGVRDTSLLKQATLSTDGLVRRILARDEPIWAHGVRESDELQGKFVTSEKIISTAALPLIAADDRVGAIFFNYRHHHSFTAEEKYLFQLFAQITAASIRDATTLEERRHFENALSIADAVGTELDLDKTLDKILTRLTTLFEAVTPTPCVLTYDEAREVLEFTNSSQRFYQITNPHHQHLTSVSVTDGKSIVSQLARESLESGIVQLRNVPDVNDREAFPNYLPLRLETRSEICVTLINTSTLQQTLGPKLLGVLALESPIPNAFDGAETAQLLEAVSRQISIALERAWQSKQLRLKTMMATRTSWATDIIHEGASEVYNIGSLTQWLNDEPNLSPPGRSYIAQIGESVEQLARTIKDARLWSVQTLERHEVDRLLKQWVTEMVRRKERGDIQIELDLNCPAQQVEIHQKALESVVRHLVNNALESMARAGRLIVRTRRLRTPLIEVQIEDSGPGVSAEIRTTLFQDEISTKGTGRGLGLLSVRFMVEQMGGSIRVEQTSDERYAVFTFTLPIAAPPPPKEL